MPNHGAHAAVAGDVRRDFVIDTIHNRIDNQSIILTDDVKNKFILPQ